MNRRPMRFLAVVASLVIASSCNEAPGGASPQIAGCPVSQPPALAAGETRTVTIATDLGEMVIRIEADLAPIATGNFVALAECGYYDNVVFHRVVPGFVIQAGDGLYGRSPAVDPARVGSGDAGYEIQDEPVTVPYERGAIAMGRTSQPNSQGSQFFIVLDDQAAFSLIQANNYAILGWVVSGMETADAIAAAADAEQPSDPIVMVDVNVTAP